MEKRRKMIKILIVIIIFLLILLTISIIIMKELDKKKKADIQENNEVEVDYLGDYEKQRAEQGITEDDAVAVLEEDPNEYYCVKQIIDSFCTYVNYLNADSDKMDLIVSKEQEKTMIEEYRKEGIETIKGMLSENYVTEKNVTDDSIYSMLGKYSYHEYNIDYMFNVKDSDYIHTYYVYGKFSQFSDSFNFIVILDKYNYTFSMFLNDYFDGKEYKYDDISTMKTLHIKSIKLNDYNKLEYKSISRESIAIDYYNSFIDLMEKDSNSAYALLNESYRTLRFADSNIFYKYVTDNISALKEASVSRYLVTQYDNYTDYICIDSLGNNFIFRATAINKYSVILDSYTMLLDEYVKEYNEANDEEKAMKCLYKFFEMINQDDYEKAYSILNKSFKDSNFSTLESFKQFVNDNWFNYNSIISCQISQVDGNYILNIDLADERSIGSYNSISKSGSFIVKLGENMCNFELSFKVN